ncbi:acetyltransferase [Myxosarcina sp. GI1(2024)]
MFLKHKQTGNLIKVLSVVELFEPTNDSITGKLQSGEDEHQHETYKKEQLVFPSGEELPLCWVDSEYRSKISPE